MMKLSYHGVSVVLPITRFCEWHAFSLSCFAYSLICKMAFLLVPHCLCLVTADFVRQKSSSAATAAFERKSSSECDGCSPRLNTSNLEDTDSFSRNNSYEETSPENCSVDHEADLKNSREGRGGEELSGEISVALQRCLLGGKSGSDGNLLDAPGTAIKYYVAKEKSSGMTYLLKKLMFPKAALSNTGIPKVNVAAGASGDEQPEVDVSDEEFLQFDTSRVPVIVTLTKVGRHYIVEATSEEESQMCLAVSISINRQGRICGLTKRGGAGLDPSIILDMISVAKTVSEQLINTLDSHIAAAEAGEEES
ncbi:unnamed protein product [Prunus armeniaca]|uniref:Exoribonuclease phosphorolytic domain-containing protein n=1 Tax=Prunus armeniaca TaxID=36596 RepID=A0A6J5V8U1_PRUAR|nr:unnamed protein product [Prunus armeniaca]